MFKSKNRRFSYRLKIFLPISIMIWLMIGVFAYFQHQREMDMRRAAIKARVEMINARIISLHEHDEDITSFVKFLDEYYDASIYEDVSVAVYNAINGSVLADIGFVAPAPDKISTTSGILKGNDLNDSDNNPVSSQLDPSKAFYYEETVSPDGAIRVQTILPSNENLQRAVTGGNSWWILILISGLLITIVLYITTYHVARNVSYLRDFAEEASGDGNPNIDSIESKFGNDELGEISRKIIQLYRERNDAIEARELEHSVALKATEERSNMKRQMTNNISHELKTPVGVIRGYVDTLVENPDMDNDSRHHFMLKTQQHVERLCNLLNDLSTMTRLDEASTKIPREKIDFQQLIEGVKHDIEESGIAGEMEFWNDIEPDTFIVGNNALITGAIMNLAKNAINYSKGTEMGVKMLTKNERFYTFCFYDDGTGVEEEHIPYLFERFYRVDKGRSRKAGGTGLGLPIVKSTINSMGGSITVRNAKPHGLEFVFTLPRATDTNSDQSAK
ncbi:MAG: HAMP domain-containing histidine kinase [Muribaculaceae bacterium]|nr:HAMP domain-containing histidine kinase [Muribaculaceae bacterium]